MNCIARKSNSSGWLGGWPCEPKSSGEGDRPDYPHKQARGHKAHNELDQVVRQPENCDIRDGKVVGRNQPVGSASIEQSAVVL